MLKMFAASAVLAVLVAPALAGTVSVDALTPTLGGDKVIKRIALSYDEPIDAHSAAAVYDRLNQTITAACTSNPGGTNALISKEVEKCRVKTLKQAVQEIGSTELTAVARK